MMSTLIKWGDSSSNLKLWEVTSKNLWDRARDLKESLTSPNPTTILKALVDITRETLQKTTIWITDLEAAWPETP